MCSSYRKIITASFILFLLPGYIFAQYSQYDEPLRDISKYWEVNATLGANNFLGDLGGTKGKGKNFLKDYTFETNRMLAGISGTYNINNYSAVDLGFNFAMIRGADSLITNTGDFERWRSYRNLSFKSNVFEGYASYVFYPRMWFRRNDVELLAFNPYISVGLGIMHFNPRAQLNGKWYDLQPLSLEGEGFAEYPDRKPYARTKIYIPINAGLKYYFNNTLALSLGTTGRFTFTDYMDDISTTYVDPALFYKYFSPAKAAVATQLYSRSLTPWKVKPDIEKADHNNKDSYLTFYLKLSIRLDKRTYIYYPRI